MTAVVRAGPFLLIADLFLFFKKNSLHKKKSCPTAMCSIIWRSQGKNIVFPPPRSLQMFDRCLMRLMGQSRPFTSTEHLQQMFIYANRNWICWDFNTQSSPQFMETRPKFPASSEENVPAERTAPADGPHQVPPPAPPVGEQQEAQATFSPDSPNQVSYRSGNNVVWSDESLSLSHPAGVGVLRTWPKIHPVLY